jgi:methyl-accepting chemotaxis protein
MSVRSKPTRQQVQAHEEAYRLFREGRQGDLRIAEGRAVSGGLVGGIRDTLSHLSIRTRMISTFAILILAMVISGLYNYSAMKKADADFKDVATRRLLLNTEINHLQYLMADNQTCWPCSTRCQLA